MSSQAVVLSRSFSDSFAKAAWFLASVAPAAFVACLFALVFYTAPEYDDFCYFSFYLHDGFLHTLVSRYFEWQGRVLPFVLMQVPIVTAKEIGIGILPAYSITLAACMIVFLAGCGFAIIRAWPGLSVPTALFLVLTFASAILGTTTDIHDLLYWVAALACYVPPGVISIVILGECVRALDGESKFSWLGTCSMAVGSFLATICNEYTAAWLIAIVGTSLLARRYLGQKLQVGHHVLIGAAVLVGAAIVLLAPGNSSRLVLAGGLRIHEFGYLAPRAMNYALLDLGRFLLSPAVIGWSFIVAIVTLAESTRPVHPRGGLLALGVVAVCLGCCYFEYLTAHLSTGLRLVERAQNQALILLLFGITLSISLLMRTYRGEICRRLPFVQYFSLGSVAVPTVLGCIIAASLYMSPTGYRLRAEREAFYPFWEESLTRDRMLATSEAPSVVVHKHKWTPSILLGSDVSIDTSYCMALYYNKSEIIPAEHLND